MTTQNPTYNLDEDAAEHFEFILQGNKYRMRYPTTEEIEQADKLETDEQKNDVVYEYISPVDNAPPVREVLKKVNIKVVKKFNQMVRTEFGG